MSKTAINIFMQIQILSNFVTMTEGNIYETNKNYRQLSQKPIYYTHLISKHTTIKLLTKIISQNKKI